MLYHLHRNQLLMNKHKTIDTKLEQAKAHYECQIEAYSKDFVLEKRLIERRRDKLTKRKKEIIAEKRAKSVLEEEKEEEEVNTPTQERSFSAPSNNRRGRSSHRSPTKQKDKSPHQGLPKLGLKHTPLFGGTPLRPRMFLETASGLASESRKARGGDVWGDLVLSATKSGKKSGTPDVSDKKPPVPPTPPADQPTSRRLPNVTFLDYLEEDEEFGESNIVVEVKPKTVEEKVREFLQDMDRFNSRPATACSKAETEDSLISGRPYHRMSGTPSTMAANRYNTFTLDRKKLEKAFDTYCENKNNEDLFKAMKLAAKMKAHIRQARNSSVVSTMATFKGSRSFMKLLKRQTRKNVFVTEPPN